MRMGDMGWGFGTLLPTLSSCEAMHWEGFTCPTMSPGTPKSGVQAGSTPMCWRWGWSDPSPGGFVPGCTMTCIKASWAVERGPVLVLESTGRGGRPQAPPNNNPPGSSYSPGPLPPRRVWGWRAEDKVQL